MLSRDDSRAVQRRYARWAGRYDQRWARYTRDSLGPTLRGLATAPAGPLLDVGCGTGVLLAAVTRLDPDTEAVGVDLTAEMLERARARLGPGVPLVQADAAALPLAPDTFARVVTTSALHHWPRPAAALAEIARVTATGGALVVTDWCDDFLITRLFSRAGRLLDDSYRRSYRSAELVEMLHTAGYDVLGVERYRSYAPWGLMTVTARRR